MANEFKVEIPIEQSGSNSGNSGGGKNLGFGKLAGAVAAGNLASMALSTIMEGLMKTLEPLINILKALFVIVFLPLMPLIMELTKILGSLISGMAQLFKGEINIVEFIKSFLAPALLDIILAFIKFAWDIGQGIANGITDIIKFLVSVGDDIGNWMRDKWTQMINWISEQLISAWSWVINGIRSVWDWLKGAWDTLINSIINAGTWVGEKLKGIWDILKSPFVWLGKKIRSLWDRINPFSRKSSSKSVNDAIISPNGQIITTAPDDYIIATKNPFNLGGNSSNITINVTGNKFNNEQDMRKMVNMISNELQKKAGRSMSR